MNDSSISVLIKCTDCGGPATLGRRIEPLCAACAVAAHTVDIMTSQGLDMNKSHFELIEQAIAELRKDEAAFRTVRRYTALLNTDVAIALFLDPKHSFCLAP